MAASCVGSDVPQTAGGEKAVTLSRRLRRGPETNPSGSDNLLTEVCALTSWKYSLFRGKHAAAQERH